MRGELRVHLGAAPGVGKTHAALDEARRRQGRGATVLVAAIATHGRSTLPDLLADVPAVATKTDGSIDIEAVSELHPDVVVVDELVWAGGANERWRQVDQLLDRGFDVITTLNIHEVESLRDLAGAALGTVCDRAVPDVFLRNAQIELVDMTPQALQRRLAHGNVLAPGDLDAAMANAFRTENLATLRLLTLRWLADHVDSGSARARETIAVAVSGAPTSDVVVRRAAQLAGEMHAPLIGVHVRVKGPVDGALRQRQLLEDVGGAFLEVDGDEVASALVRAARSAGASQIVIGSSTGRQSLVSQVVRAAAGEIDIHVIAETTEAATRIPPRHPGALSRSRVLVAWAFGGVAPPIVTALLAAQRDRVDVASALLVELLVVVCVAALGGAVPAVVAAVLASALVNWYLTPPLHRWTIDEAEDVLALVVFLVVGSVVGAFVARAARRSAEAARARAEAATLAGLAATSVEADPLDLLVDRLRTAFNLRGVAVVTDGRKDAASGEVDVGDPAATHLSLGGASELILAGAALTADDQAVLRAFADHLRGGLRARMLQQDATAAHVLAEADELRNALLSAVSHDLRTPLASIKATVSGLLQDDVVWPVATVRSFLESVDEETDRLDHLVGNLLDMSRLRTGTLQMAIGEVGADDAVAAALRSLGDEARSVVVDVPSDLPRLVADPGLLERALANVIANALRASELDPVRVEAGVVSNQIHIRVVDRGPGIGRRDRERVFQPFQRLGDHSSDGVGLGLAVSRGFVEAMHGDLTVEDTPGGGATLVIRLPVAP